MWDDPHKPLDCLVCPAIIPKKLKTVIEDLSNRSFTALGCRDWSRIDIRLDEQGKPNVLEINTLPGVIPNPQCNSRFPKAARSAGLTYNQMILKVLEAAIVRYQIAK